MGFNEVCIVEFIDYLHDLKFSILEGRGYAATIREEQHRIRRVRTAAMNGGTCFPERYLTVYCVRAHSISLESSGYSRMPTDNNIKQISRSLA